jgi:23S rRNA (adenine2503-C2)-methyltransferase
MHRHPGRIPPEEPSPILGLCFEEMVRIFEERWGRGRHRAATVFREFYRKDNSRFHDPAAFGFPPAAARDLGCMLCHEAPHLDAIVAADGIVKFVTRLKDGCRIESVILPMATHGTLCVSTQVGCRMGCLFCSTGRQGFVRDLSAAEIVGQMYTARKTLGRDIRNIVFMGMGEPMDNLDSVLQAVRVLKEDRGFAVAHRRMTLSTAGLVGGIHRLARIGWPNLRLAVSLNAPNDRIRSQLMPVNRRFGMARLREALLDYPLKRGGAIFVEYILIRGINDAREHARELADYLRPLPARLNLIAFNPGADDTFTAPDDTGVRRFRDWLVAEKVFVRIRSPRGRPLAAGCGQLGGMPQWMKSPRLKSP